MLLIFFFREKVKINIWQEGKEGAIFACNSVPGSQTSPAIAIERRIDERYLAPQDDGSCYRVQGSLACLLPSVNVVCLQLLTDSFLFLFVFFFFPQHSLVYRSLGKIADDQKSQLRIYVVAKAHYGAPSLDSLKDELDIQKIGDKAFLESSSQHTIDLYQNILKKASKIPGPVIEGYDVSEPGQKERRIVICYRRGTTSKYVHLRNHFI